jgi:hypothetical protein
MDAQWLGYPTPGIPRTRDGKANLTARTPQDRDSKPDLSGFWATEPAPADLRGRLIPDVTIAVGEESLSQYFLNIFSDFKPGDEPVRPQEAAALHEREAAFSRVSPIAHCLPEGMPLVEMAPAPYKIIQHPGLTVMLYPREHCVCRIRVYRIRFTGSLGTSRRARCSRRLLAQRALFL